MTISEVEFKVQQYLDQRGVEGVLGLVALQSWGDLNRYAARHGKAKPDPQDLALLADDIGVEMDDLLLWLELYMDRPNFWKQLDENYECLFQAELDKLEKDDSWV